MKRFILFTALLLTLSVYAQEIPENTALLIIDVQEFYFPGGNWELENPEEAAGNAALLLEAFRSKGFLVVHVRHQAKEGANIHRSVRPLDDELVFTKDEVNSFKGTALHDSLVDAGIQNLVICGMQTHMCVEAATRAASDYGFTCTLVGDACATRDLSFDGRVVKAADVHASTLNTLKSYATITDTPTFLQNKD